MLKVYSMANSAIICYILLQVVLSKIIFLNQIKYFKNVVVYSKKVHLIQNIFKLIKIIHSIHNTMKKLSHTLVIIKLTTIRRIYISIKTDVFMYIHLPMNLWGFKITFGAESIFTIMQRCVGSLGESGEHTFFFTQIPFFFSIFFFLIEISGIFFSNFFSHRNFGQQSLTDYSTHRNAHNVTLMAILCLLIGLPKSLISLLPGYYRAVCSDVLHHNILCF